MRSNVALLLLAASLAACQRESVRRDGMQSGNGAADADGRASASAAPSAPTGGQTAEGAGRKDETPPRAAPPVIARRDGPVGVEPDPACGNDTASGIAGTDGAAASPKVPPSNPEIRPYAEAVERELENWRASIAGTGRDDRRGAMIVVLQQDFADYDGLRQKLQSVSGPIQIVLQPACHARKDIDEARRVLEARDWHPRAKSALLGWYFDARFSGFFVSVDQAAPEVASSLTQRLGKLVRTRLEPLSTRLNPARGDRSRPSPSADAPTRRP